MDFCNGTNFVYMKEANFGRGGGKLLSPMKVGYVHTSSLSLTCGLLGLG